MFWGLTELNIEYFDWFLNNTFIKKLVAQTSQPE